jgi:hypothetical protein
VHWNGSTTVIPGPPHKVSQLTGTHYEPWVVAGQDGAIDIVYYATREVADVSTINNKPQQTDTRATWDVFMAQSLDHGRTFTESKVSDAPNGVYFGDICSTGIFCGNAPPTSNWAQDRTLYDVFGAAVGPDGALRTAWTDARDTFSATCRAGAADQSCEGGPGVKTHVYFACQKTGTTLYGTTLTGVCPHGSITSFPPVTTVSQAPSPARSTLPNTSRPGSAAVARLPLGDAIRRGIPALAVLVLLAGLVTLVVRGGANRDSR